MMTASPNTDPKCDQMSPEVIERIKGGDQAAFETLVKRYQALAYSLAMRFVWDRQEADDIVQDAFIRVWENINEYRPEYKFTSWLYAIVTRLSIDRVRYKSRWRRVAITDEVGAEEQPGYALPDQQIDDRELIALVRQLVEQLPRTQRIVFTLRDLQDLSMDEAVQVTGMSATSVKANLCHARKRIRQLIDRTNWFVGS
jgi:RNA polymerase sigma-70 factor, ECF subfamily